MNQSASFKIAVVLEGDNSNANKAIADTDKKISNLGKGSSLKDLVQSAKSDFGSIEGIASSAAEKIPIPFTAAAGAIAGVSAAIAGTAAGLFALAKNASDFGSAIFDVTQKTGLSAETISTLKLAADQSGSSIEAISGSITKFSKLIGESAEGSKTAAQSLTRLGLDPKAALNDLDGSLEKVFTQIYNAKNPIVATKLATEAFGKSGADLIPVIKQMNGDFGAFKEEAKKLGVVLTDADAQSADEFGDTLVGLRSQVGGLTRQFGQELMPGITMAMKEISHQLTLSRGDFEEWGKATASIVGGTAQFIRGIGNAWRLAKAGYIYYMTGMSTPGDTIFGKERKKSPLDGIDITGVNFQKMMDGAKEPALTNFGDGGKSAENARKKALDAQIKSAELDAKGAKETYDTFKKTLDEQLKNEAISLDDYQKQFSANIDTYSEAIGAAFAKKQSVIAQRYKGAEYDNARKELDLDLSGIKSGIGEDSVKAGEDVRARRLKTEQNLNQALVDGAKLAADKELAINEDKFRRLEKSEFDYLTGKEAIQNKALEVERTGIDRVMKMSSDAKDKGGQPLLKDSEYTELLNRRRAINQEIENNHTEIVASGAQARLEITRKAESDERELKKESDDYYYESAQQRLQKLIDSGVRVKQNLAEQIGLQQDFIDRQLNDPTDGTVARLEKERGERLKTVQGAKDQKLLEDEINGLYEQRIDLAKSEAANRQDDNEERYAQGVKDSTSNQYGGGFIGGLAGNIAVMSDETISVADKTQSAAKSIQASWNSIGQSVSAGVNNMVDALGNAIEGWLLYGSSIGKALKQAAAAELAHIASTSAIQAIYQTALGFASLFYNPAEAASHFTAAGLFAAVAVGAGVGAKALSGGKDKGGSSGGSSSGGASSTSDNLSAQYPSGNSDNISTFTRQSADNGNAQAIQDLRTTIESLNNKITSMKAGDVLAAGIKQKKNLIAETATNELASNATLNRKHKKIVND